MRNKSKKSDHTGSRREYPDAIRQKAIKHNLEVMDFRRIEKLIIASCELVSNRVKRSANEIREKEGKERKKMFSLLTKCA